MSEFHSLLDLDSARPRFQARIGELETELGKPEVGRDPQKLKTLGREHRQVELLLELYVRRDGLLARKKDNDEVLAADEDPELVSMANEDNAALVPELEDVEEKIFLNLAPPDPQDSRNTIFEIRAGTGGDEAALFAGDIFRMYLRVAEQKGWKVEMMDSSPTNLGGFKEVTFMLQGENVYGYMKFESGVHRVQRVPETEAQGRLHTSAISVAVLPEAEEVDVDIKPDEIRVDIFCSSGPGGQSVNTTYSAVRLTHLPTGIVVSCQDEKSQIKNRAKALTVLRARILAKIQAERDAEIGAIRRSQVRTGDRSEKIRTYNYPQNRVTDHRINLSLYKLDRIMQGELDEIVSALRKAEAMERLQEAAG